MYLTFAWRYFRGKKSANAINIIAWVTVGVIAFATACQILVLSVFNGFEGLVKSLYSSFYADIKIIPATGKTFILSAEKINQLKQIQSIENYSFIAEEKALLQNEAAQSQSVIYLKGVDENYSNVAGIDEKITSGHFNIGTIDTPGIVMGYGIQNAIGASVSEAFPATLLTVILPKKNNNNPDPLESISEGMVKASGTFSIQQEFDNKYAITNIDFVKQQMKFGADEYSALEIKTTNNANIKDTQKAIQQLLGNDFVIQNRYQQNTSLYNTMQLEKWAIFAVLTLILIIAAFNMVSALTMLVLEKKKDISVLQSLGASKNIIQKIFLTEGLLLGAVGTFIGIGIAVMICLLQLKFKLIKLQGGSFLIDYFPVKIVATDFILVTATATLIAFVASWFPAYKASRQSFELR
jgi:lipoprotein-releasing system permease protein